MKVACCQYAPKFGAVEHNMAYVDSFLKNYNSNDIDLLVLPEMAFTGYVFLGLEEIKPYLEDPQTGPTVTWAKRQAKRLKCYVVVGYPLMEGDQYYNGLCCVNQLGEVVETYRKSFLYQTDETWALEGPGFVSVKIDGLGKVGFGICMDINPYQFKADFNKCEFANFHLKEDTDFIICCMAWLRSESDELKLINYWAMRLLPLFSNTKQGKNTYFIASNRTGTERGNVFAGASCVLNICGTDSHIVDYMSHIESGLMIVDIEQ